MFFAHQLFISVIITSYIKYKPVLGIICIWFDFFFLFCIWGSVFLPLYQLVSAVVSFKNLFRDQNPSSCIHWLIFHAHFQRKHCKSVCASILKGTPCSNNVTVGRQSTYTAADGRNIRAVYAITTIVAGNF